MPPRARAASCCFILMDNISLATWKSSNLAKCSSKNKAGGAALVDTDDSATVVVRDVCVAEEEEVGDGASSVSLSPSPSSWLKVGRMLAFLPTNLTKRLVTAGGGGSLVECQMSRVNKVKFLSERFSGVPPFIFVKGKITFNKGRYP